MDSDGKMSVEIRSRKQQLGRVRVSLTSLPKAAVTKAVISLRKVKVNRDSSAQLALFLLKVGALEAVRRLSQHRCPPLWLMLQGIPLLHTPLFAWMRRWAPFRHLLRGTQVSQTWPHSIADVPSQVFSKPVVFLSIATALTSAIDHSAHDPPSPPAQPPSRPATPLRPEQQQLVSPAPCESGHGTSQLRSELEKQGILVPERMNDEELQRFFVAANGNARNFAALVKRSLRWRENFRFLSSQELEEWSRLVYWHQHDSQGRPLLIIRLGVASSTLLSSQRPRFVQAIVSQIEYGVVNLLSPQDPRLTVVLDCAGAPSVGFPLHMTKSCCVLVQENYPTRLAALFIVNLPPLVRVVANAIVQILKPATREKIYVESDTRILAEHLGGMDWVPIYLAGTCKCSLCNQARAALEQDEQGTQHRQRRLLFGSTGNEDRSAEDDDIDGYERDLVVASPYQKCTGVLRVTIVALLMLWLVVTLLAGLYDPQLDSSLT